MLSHLTVMIPTSTMRVILSQVLQEKISAKNNLLNSKLTIEVLSACTSGAVSFSFSIFVETIRTQRSFSFIIKYYNA